MCHLSHSIESFTEQHLLSDFKKIQGRWVSSKWPSKFVFLKHAPLSSSSALQGIVTQVFFSYTWTAWGVLKAQHINGNSFSGTHTLCARLVPASSVTVFLKGVLRQGSKANFHIVYADLTVGPCSPCLFTTITLQATDFGCKLGGIAQTDHVCVTIPPFLPLISKYL